MKRSTFFHCFKICGKRAANTVLSICFFSSTLMSFSVCGRLCSLPRPDYFIHSWQQPRNFSVDFMAFSLRRGSNMRKDATKRKPKNINRSNAHSSSSDSLGQIWLLLARFARFASQLESPPIGQAGIIWTRALLRSVSCCLLLVHRHRRLVVTVDHHIINHSRLTPFDVTVQSLHPHLNNSSSPQWLYTHTPFN